MPVLIFCARLCCSGGVVVAYLCSDVNFDARYRVGETNAQYFDSVQCACNSFGISSDGVSIVQRN